MDAKVENQTANANGNRKSKKQPLPGAIAKRMKNEKSDTLLLIALLVLALAIFMWSLKTGLNRSEIAECLQWQNDSNQFAGFYLTSWQDQQCRAHGIVVNAPVQ